MKRILFLVLFSQLSFCYSQQHSKINFEKITFISKGCEGSCPYYILKLNGNKELKLFAIVSMVDTVKVWKIDSSKTGYFTGVANDSLFNRLAYILDSVGINRW
jgi:hypothetical protein